MIDTYMISVIAFILFLGIIVYLDRKNIKREFILLLRKTNKGKGFLTKTGGRFTRFWKVIGTLGVVLCFLVSIGIFYQFLLITANNLTAEAVPGVGLLLPSPSATASIGPGYFAVPFWYWVIVIGLLALVHEGFHGIMAAMEKIKIKSLGWGLFLVIPLAFVEPDERQLVKKRALSQLRVFAAGSFANFILALVAFVVLGLLVFGTFAQAGVGFGGYHANKISWENITTINGMSVSGKEDIAGYMNTTTQAGFILTAGDDTYFLPAEDLEKQLNKSSDQVIVYEDYSAKKENLTETIIEVNGQSVLNTTHLRKILEEIGPDQEINVITTNGTVNRSFVLKTREEPVPVFKPDTQVYVMISLEHVFPGTIDFTSDLYKTLTLLMGGEEIVNWQTVQFEIKFWEWAEDNYPEIRERVEKKLTYLEMELEKYPRSGYIGITNVYTKLEPKEEFKMWEEPVLFIQGLLFWMFLINFGVGAFNLLPIRALDGGRMWEILLQKVAGKRTARRIINNVSTFIVFLILLNFFIMLKPF